MPPRRITRTPVRKSVRKSNPSSSAKSAADSQETPSSTTTNSKPSSSPTIETTPKTSPKIIPNSGEDFTEVPIVKPSEAAIETEESPAITASKSTQEIIFSAEPSTQGTTFTTERKAAPIDENINVTNPTFVEHETAPSETLSENTTTVKSRETLDAKESLSPEIASNTAVVPQNVDGSGQEAAIKAVSKTGGKTVVKKTVRIVKKLVKKKVPKRVQKMVNGETEEKAGTAKDGENPNPIVLGGTEVENPKPLESVSMEIKNHNADSSTSVSKKVGNSESNVTVLVEAENSNTNLNDSVSMEVENADTHVSIPEKPEAENLNTNLNDSVSMEVENANTHVSILEKPEACEGDLDVSLTENLSEAPDSVAAKNNQSEKTLSVTETQLEDESSIPDQSDECETENVNSRGGEEEVENCEVSGLKEEVRMVDVVLSGEMEALERRRKRKTEIFIGGLDKDSKEEDVRKIFEEVGAIVEVRLVMNSKTGKNKGFAFVRFASAADAKKALAKYPKVEICGKQCRTSLVEGNDTIFLGNIVKHWKSEDVLKLLQEIGIEKIDKVTVMDDPNKIGCNRGYAFLELETCKDAQNAYKKLQKKDVFGKHQKIKVAWAEPLKEPDEEEMLKVKSVYAEYIPSSWTEENVRNYFKKFGEIENVALARNLGSSKRKDFAFINYTTREAALACIEAFRRESFNDDGSKVNVKVSLAKPLPKGKEIKPVSNPISKESSKVKLKVAQSVTRPHEPRNKGKSYSSGYENVGIDKRSSTTAELVQLLREQASWTQSRTSLGIGSLDQDHPYPSPGRKRPFSGDDSLYSDLRGYPRARLESSFPTTSLSYGGLSQGVGATSLPYYHQQGAGYASGSLDGTRDYTNSYQTRGAPYGGSSSLYHRFR
ncbi:nucleolin 2-like [Cornus florida]|uniref:nucleolin 2-like n=1 Tax=Cornus florida TaxID=4283 RepID=UPI0028999681|nr:nucleolin 2-like [Cornus florida]